MNLSVPMHSLVFVTTNLDKWREATRILRRPLEHHALDIPEIQAATTAEVALEKARVAAEKLGRDVVIEDTGLELLAFGGFPGPYIKWWEKQGGLASLCRSVDSLGRGAVAVCALAVSIGGQRFVVEGRVNGTIAREPRGTGGFGWDAILIPEGHERTFGEMSRAEKDAISHRRRAWELLSTRLEGS